MGKITRRLMLGTAGAAVLGGVAYGGSRIACRFVPRNHPDFFSLLDLAPDDAAAREVARAVLQTPDRPRDLAGLYASLAERPLIQEALGESCPATRRSLVQDQCALDFTEGRTVEIDGWLLSETEASLCAGRALLARGKGSLA